ncbi:MAG: tape measure protein [Lactobacillus sp.]|uniref:tape measure protein n=1 Tax=Lactobacillus sp. TaxID=1591 RepID=UPI002647FA4A|nr:tape measure protein [Lactobacillus sp.]MDN5955100.1 tape measure protein [Lactobacillus sp.]MDN5988592.1 tape measure protein [Lactobacillus sp.]MDN6007628.1 tape measure protein [Lactobacillus sp.]MDN6589935.1 tape measure protein [Lactobacillus sp.]MDN6652548.1 tape measure protein [Lactobacillus sp.]
MPEISATIRVVDAFSNPLDKLANGLSRAQSGFSRLKGALGGNMFGSAEKSSSGLFKSMTGGVVVGNMISKGMGLAGSGIRSMLGELNEASTSWQTFDGNMHQLGASDTQIAKAKAEMQQFAQQTIYSASDMSSTYAQLAAVGTKNTAQLVKGFGGLASAADNPQQAMKTLSEQATQMAAKPKVQWQDFKLMLEQTPAGISAVAKTMGESTTQLIQDIQDGKVKTQDFLNAVAKTGTNANFSRMATQYKTVGQAMDGLKETLANKLQPAFDKVGKVGIDWVSQLTDRLDKLDLNDVGDKIAGALGKIDISKVFDGISKSFSNIMPLLSSLGKNLGQSLKGFLDTGALNNIGSTVQNIVSTITNAFDRLNNLGGGNLFGNIGQALGNALNAVLPVINTIISAISNALVSIMPILATIGSALGQAFTMIMPVIQNMISEISSAISAMAPLITTVLGAAIAIIGPMISTIAQTISTAFAGVAQGLAPLANAFRQLQAAAAPLGPALSIVGKALGLLGGAALASVALGIGVIVDAFTSLISIASAVGFAVKGIVQSMHALGDAITGNFAGAKNDIQDAASAFGQLKSSIGNVGNAIGNGVTANLAKQFSQMGNSAQQAANKVNNIKIKPQVDVATANRQLASISNKKIPAPKIEQPKLNFTNPFHSLITTAKSTKLPAPTIQAPRVQGGANIGQSITKSVPKTIPAPKVSTPKVPTPKTPAALKQISAPKVGTPKVPTPKTPATLKQIPAPKVGTPKVPTPRLPHLGTIPAPKVARPNMSGVVSAVNSGMERAAAAARAGGAQISAAVRSALNQAIATARSAAGAMQAAGVMIGQGLANGIRSQVGAVAAAANELVAQANRAARAAAQIHSPSILFAEVGSFIGQGMAVGMDSTRGLISQSSRAMINSAYPGLNSSINSSGSLSSGSLSSSSIRPNSATSSNYYTGGTNNSSEITIAPGAIVINSSGNPEEDADALLDRLEEKIMGQADKSLS